MYSRISTHTYGSKSFRTSCIKMGHEIKVEQQGAMGQVNAITKEEAQSADFVLIASDQTISGMERFDGKKY